MRTIIVLLLLIVTYGAGLNIANARLCLVSDPTGTSLNVRDAPNANKINALRNGRRLVVERYDWDERGRSWALVSGEYEGEWRDWGWVFADYLNCREIESGHKYPVVFGSSLEMDRTGLSLVGYASHRKDDVKQEHECFFYGDGGYDLSMSDERLQKLRMNGISFEAACVVLRSDQLKYDPQTGQRLPTYHVANLEEFRAGVFDGISASAELPLKVPKCFRGAAPRKREFYWWEIPLNCEPQYDPSTGRKLSAVEADYFMRHYKLHISGEAGPSGDEYSEETIQSKEKRASKAKLDEILDEIF